MKEIKIIPDGMNKLPPEAKDDKIIAEKLSKANVQNGPRWDRVERLIPGSNDVLILRVPEPGSGSLPETAVKAFANAVVNDINGVKKHPEGVRKPNRRG